MSTEEAVTRLRAQIEALESVGKAEVTAAEAKAAYAKDPSEETKAAHREAAQYLVDARQAVRVDRVSLVRGDAVRSEGEEE